MRDFKRRCSVLIAILSLFLHRPANASIFDRLASLEKDKYVHFSAGVVISHLSYPFFKKYISEEDAWVYSLSLVLVCSVGKEIYDIPRTGFNWGDIAAGMLGGMTILVVKF